MKIRIIDLLKTTTYNINVSVNGWVRTHRQSKNISFIAIMMVQLFIICKLWLNMKR